MNNYPLYYIIDILMLVFEMFGLWYLFKEMPLKQKRAKYIVFLFIFLFFFVQFISWVGIGLFWKVAIELVVYTIALSLFYDIPLAALFIEICIYFVILFGVENVVVMIWDFFDPGSFVVEFGNQQILKIELNILFRTVSLGTIIIVERLRREREKEYKWKDIRQFLVSMITPIIVLVCLSINIDYIEDDRYITNFVICSILVLVSFVSSHHLMNTMLKKSRTEEAKKLKLQELEIKNSYYYDKHKRCRNQ